MLRLVFSVALGLLFSVSYGQLKKFYSLKSCSGYDTVNFSLEAPTGNCFITAEHPDNGPLNIYGNPDLDKVNPSFQANISNNTCRVNLNLEEYNSSSIGNGILYAMLGQMSTPDNNYWKILFDNDKIYKLDLNYGLGSANVDLSNTSIKNLKIRSGSADVQVDYATRVANPISMDTFLVAVDMGSLLALNIDCANTSQFIAHVGFGSAQLDFSESTKKKCNVNATVGAGNLDIYLPSNDTPIIIYMKESPLCGVKLVHGFEQVEKNVFVNMAYKANAENLITFNLDVALGNVTFH
jgi:hypothetical protein